MKDDFNDLFKDMFGFNGEDDFNGDVEETEIDKAKLEILEQMKTYLDKTIDAVKFHEIQNERSNFNILSRYVQNMIDIQYLESCEEDELSEEEKIEKIKAIQFSVNDLSVEDAATYSDEDETNISGEEIIEKFMKKQNEIGNEDDGNNPNNDDTDW